MLSTHLLLPCFLSYFLCTPYVLMITRASLYILSTSGASSIGGRTLLLYTRQAKHRRQVTWSEVSFLCSACDLWVHRRCSGLTRPSQYSPSWICLPYLPLFVPTHSTPPPSRGPTTTGRPLPSPSPPSPTPSISTQSAPSVPAAPIQLQSRISPPPFPTPCPGSNNPRNQINVIFQSLIFSRLQPCPSGGGLAFLIHHSISYTMFDSQGSHSGPRQRCAASRPDTAKAPQTYPPGSPGGSRLFVRLA